MTQMVASCRENIEDLLIERNELRQRLQEAQAAAESAAESKSIFIANISHEIRTPLNGMIAVSQLLLRTSMTPEQRELALTIEESGLSLLSILGQVLDFSCLGRAGVELRATPLYIRDVIEGSLEAAGPDAASRDVRMSYRLPPALATRQVEADPVRLRQALSSLVNNAVKFNVDGGDVEVEATITSNGSALSITVRDTGIGMEPDIIAASFQSFKQAEDGLSRKHGGAGLGLPIASRLVEAMGGTIEVQSAPGQGSVFTLSVPLVWARPIEGNLITTLPLPTPAALLLDPHGENPSNLAALEQAEEEVGEVLPIIKHDHQPENNASSDSGGQGMMAWPDTPSGSVAAAVRYPSSVSLSTTNGESRESAYGYGSTATLSSYTSVADVSTHSRRSSNSSARDPAAHSPAGSPLPPAPSASSPPPLPAAVAHHHHNLGLRPAPAPTADHRTSMFFSSSAALDLTTSRSAPARSAPESPTSETAPSCTSSASNISTVSGSSANATALAGRCVLIDIDHTPTMMQITDSCTLAGMVVIHGRSSIDASAGSASQAAVDEVTEAAKRADVCVTSPEKVMDALRSGWRGRPVVAVGLKKDLPMAVQPVVTVVATPLKHDRLVSMLRQALAPHDASMEAPLHADPDLLQALSAGGSASTRSAAASNAAWASRRSVDNSSLERRVVQLSEEALQACAQNAGIGVEKCWRPALETVLSEGTESPRARDTTPDGYFSSPAGATATATATAADLDSATASSSPRSPRILVAEDNVINVRVVLRVLSHVCPDAEVDVACNGVEVLEAVTRRQYDLILMDIHMPEMDGLEATRRLREQLPLSEMPTVVALTADTMQDLPEKCIAVGMSDFVSKPFTVEDVQRVLALAMAATERSNSAEP